MKRICLRVGELFIGFGMVVGDDMIMDWIGVERGKER